MKSQGMRKGILAAAAILVLLLTLPAVAETLEPFQPDPAGKAAWPFRMGPISSGAFARPAPDSGTVHPHATVTTFQTAIGTVNVALDARSVEAEQPDLLRIDFSGSGRFNDTDVIPLQPWEYFRTRSERVKLSFQRDGRTIPVIVSVPQYYKRGERRMMRLEMVIAARGALRFGEQSRDVIVFDGNSNLKLGDLAKPDRKFAFAPPCDTVLIAGADGKFDSPDAQAIVLGQPVKVGEVLYTVQVGEDGWSASAVPFDGPVGMIQVAHPHWEGLFVGQEHVVRLAGGDQPQPVPADSYVAAAYTEWAGEDHGPGAPNLNCYWQPKGQGKASRQEVVAGQVTQFAVGSPLAIEPLVKVKGRQVTFDMSYADTGRTNEEVGVSVNLGKAIAEPKVLVYDAAGKQVYSGTMEFG